MAFCSFPHIIPKLEALGKCQSVELGPAKHCPSISDKAGKERGHLEEFSMARLFSIPPSPWKGFVHGVHFTAMLGGGNFVATEVKTQNPP